MKFSHIAIAVVAIVGVASSIAQVQSGTQALSSDQIQFAQQMSGVGHSSAPADLNAADDSIDYARVVSWTPVFERTYTPNAQCDGAQTDTQSPTQSDDQHNGSCGTLGAFEDNVIGYDIRYEYAGREHVTHSKIQPGDTIAVQIVPLLH